MSDETYWQRTVRGWVPIAVDARIAELEAALAAQTRSADENRQHRNKLLNRQNTPEEEEYLAAEAPDFSQSG